MPIYRIIDFMKEREIVIAPPIQERPMYPFTWHCATRFFANFINETFVFERQVRSIMIYDGKENLPRHSFAMGFLYSQTCDEMHAFAVQHQPIPKPVGTIALEYGGELTAPYVRVNLFE